MIPSRGLSGLTTGTVWLGSLLVAPAACILFQLHRQRLLIILLVHPVCMYLLENLYILTQCIHASKQIKAHFFIRRNMNTFRVAYMQRYFVMD